MRLCALASLRRNEPWSFAGPCRCAQWLSGNALQLRSGGWIHSLIPTEGLCRLQVGRVTGVAL